MARQSAISCEIQKLKGVNTPVNLGKHVYGRCVLAHLALGHGSLSARSAVAHAPATCLASWAKSLRAIHRRDNAFGNAIPQALQLLFGRPSCLHALSEALRVLEAHSFPALRWSRVLGGVPPAALPDESCSECGRPRHARVAVSSACYSCFHVIADLPGALLSVWPGRLRSGPIPRVSSRCCLVALAWSFAAMEALSLSACWRARARCRACSVVLVSAPCLRCCSCHCSQRLRRTHARDSPG